MPQPRLPQLTGLSVGLEGLRRWQKSLSRNPSVLPVRLEDGIFHAPKRAERSNFLTPRTDEGSVSDRTLLQQLNSSGAAGPASSLLFGHVDLEQGARRNRKSILCAQEAGKRRCAKARCHLCWHRQGNGQPTGLVCRHTPELEVAPAFIGLGRKGKERDFPSPTLPHGNKP